MICNHCQEDKPLERSGNCATCAHAIRKAERMKAPEPNGPIAKVSDKMGKQLGKYAAAKAKFIKGKNCGLTIPHDCEGALTIHHMQGRVGFADEYAREKELPLLIDDRFFLAVCLNGHTYIENNKKWACENGYTFLRVTDPVFQRNALTSNK